MNAKNWGHMKLLVIQILEYFKEINNIFVTIKVYFEIQILNWYKTHFSWKLEKNNYYLAGKKTFSVSEGPLLNTLKKNRQNEKCMQIFKCFTVKNLFVTTSVHFIVKNLELLKIYTSWNYFLNILANKF